MEKGEDALIRILQVEDTEMDQLIVKRALEKSKLKTLLFVCEDGEEALNFLHNRGKYASEAEYPKPDIILLDLRLPKIDGTDVLKEIKSEEKLKDIPVVIFTTSEQDMDMIKTFEEGVRSYILKSSFLQKTAEMEGLIEAIISFMR